MNRRMTLGMTIAVVGGFGIIILMNIAALFGLVPSKYISPNDVRGMAIEHNQVLYTLNFAQQNALVDIFNRSIPVTSKEVEARKINTAATFPIQKIIIYRFNAPDIVITPISIVTKAQSVLASEAADLANLVFSTPAWNSNGLLEEPATDHIYKILANAYDR